MLSSRLPAVLKTTSSASSLEAQRGAATGRTPQRGRGGLARTAVLLAVSAAVGCSVDYTADDAEYDCKRDPATCSAGSGGGGTGGSGSGGSPSGGTGGAGTGGSGGTGGSSGGAGGGGAAGSGGSGGAPTCPTAPGPPMALLKAPAGGPSYCIDTSEVTYAQYQKFLDAKVPTGGQGSECSFNQAFAPAHPAQGPTTCTAGTFDFTGKENRPVVCVDWCDAAAYCKWAGKRLCGKVGGGAYATPDEFKSASTSEWHNACTGGGTLVFPYGNAFVSTTCNGLDLGLNATVAAKSLTLCHGNGAFQDLFDLSGNVWEWESHCGGTTGENDYCRMRGGAYSAGETLMRCDADGFVGRGQQATHLGLRCCADPN